MNGLARRSVVGRFALGEHTAVRRRGPRAARVAVVLVPVAVALLATYGISSIRQQTGDGRLADVATFSIVGLSLLSLMLLRTRGESARKELQARLAHQAFHDPLTDLANRNLLKSRLEHALARVSRKGDPMGLLFIDLDDFKKVNDTLGHDAGDSLLLATATRLRSCVRASDTIARLGGDEFAVLLEEMSEPRNAVEVAARIIEALAEPVEVAGHSITMTCSVGVSLGVDGTESAEALLGDADMAMYAAKSNGKGCCEVFRPGLRADLIAEIDRETELQRAIEEEQFVLHYQPIVELDRHEIVGVEALVRWMHPERGMLPPADFIPLAEETGLIVPLGRWILDEACRQARSWQLMGSSDLPFQLSVNLSPVQFNQPHLVGEVQAALAASGMPAECLVLEITENALMSESETMRERLEELKALGVRLAVDDFGVGYSSLSYLRKFPVDHLKIDRSFVQGAGEGPEDSALCEAIVKLGEHLGLETIAEGIERSSQLEWFKGKHCRFGQGFYLSRPAPAEFIDELLGMGRATGTDSNVRSVRNL
jgi:diguanylate cyclase (GGDEF)-like protein